MDLSELKTVSIEVEHLRNKVDGMQMRDYYKRVTMEMTRAMLAASWSLRVAHYCLQHAIRAVESYNPPQTSPGSTGPTGGG